MAVCPVVVKPGQRWVASDGEWREVRYVINKYTYEVVEYLSPTPEFPWDKVRPDEEARLKRTAISSFRLWIRLKEASPEKMQEPRKDD